MEYLRSWPLAAKQCRGERVGGWRRWDVGLREDGEVRVQSEIMRFDYFRVFLGFSGISGCFSKLVGLI